MESHIVTLHKVAEPYWLRLSLVIATSPFQVLCTLSQPKLNTKRYFWIHWIIFLHIITSFVSFRMENPVTDKQSFPWTHHAMWSTFSSGTCMNWFKFSYFWFGHFQECMPIIKNMPILSDSNIVSRLYDPIKRKPARIKFWTRGHCNLKTWNLTNLEGIEKGLLNKNYVLRHKSSQFYKHHFNWQIKAPNIGDNNPPKHSSR